MPRPKKNGMDYFPHDTDARNDLKLRKLRAVYGNDGYAFYFIMLENIYKTREYELDVSDAETRLILAEETRISEEKFSDMLNKCLDLELFSRELYDSNQILTSEAIKTRTEPVELKRKRNKEYFSDRNSTKNIVSATETMAESTQSRVEESRVEKSKVEYSKPSDDEQSIIDILKAINNYSVDINSDVAMIHELKNNYPEIDIVNALNEFAEYKLEKPLTERSNARNQIRTHFQKCVEWQKCLKQEEPKKPAREIWT